jgi:tRNA-dihydrouridine synthase A
MVSQEEVLERFEDYVQRELASGTALKHMTRHILGLFQGLPGAKQFRRHLSENAHKTGAGIDVLKQAGAFIRQRGHYGHHAVLAPEGTQESVC